MAPGPWRKTRALAALVVCPSHLEGVGDREVADGEGRGEQQRRSDEAHQPTPTSPDVDRRRILHPGVRALDAGAASERAAPRPGGMVVALGGLGVDRRRHGEAALRAAGGWVLWGRDDLGPPVGWCAACGRGKDHEPHAQSRTARRLPRVVDNERRLRAVVHELEEPSLSVVAADPVLLCDAEPLCVGAGRLSRG